MKQHLAIIFLVGLSLLAFKNVEFDNDCVMEFLESLNKKQRISAQMKFEDISREQWHYFPASLWTRKGVQLGALNAKQRTLLFQVLQVYLSKSGYDKTTKIIELEGILADIEGNANRRDADKYYAAFYGNPKKDSLWAWSFEGHHLSLNFTILHDEVVASPRFLGANPAIIPFGERKGEQTLVVEENLGLELINSLSKEQQQKAFFKKTSYDIETSNLSYVNPLTTVGIETWALTDDQLKMLWELIAAYLSTIREDLVKKRMNIIKKEEQQSIKFGWSGAIQKGQPHYYRIQGKSFLIEFDNTQNSGNHIHTVWRDFGRDLIKEHVKNSYHHRK